MKKIFNRAIRVLLATNLLILVAGAMVGPIYAIFVEEIGGDLLDASFAGAVFALAAGITVLISGRWSDKVKESEYIVIVGYLIMGVGFLMYLWVNSVWLLLVTQIILGLGEAIYSPAFDSIYSKHLNKKEAGRTWGAWEAMYYFSVALGAFFGGLVVILIGFKALFVIMSLLCFASSIYLLRLPRKVL